MIRLRTQNCKRMQHANVRIPTVIQDVSVNGNSTKIRNKFKTNFSIQVLLYSDFFIDSDYKKNVTDICFELIRLHAHNALNQQSYRGTKAIYNLSNGIQGSRYFSP